MLLYIRKDVIQMAANRMKLTFFDDFWVDFRPGTTRRWFQPELYSIVPDTGCYGALIYDPELKRYRIYHETMIKVCEDGPRQLKMVESEDLLHWTVVTNDEGGDVLFQGDGGVHGSSVLYDPHDPDPSRRYKYCGMTNMGTERGANHPVNLAFSADGIHWDNHPELVANPFTSDAHNKLFYNPCSGEYNLLHRSAYVDRRVFIRSSKDLVNWSEPRVLLHPAGVYNDEHTEMQHYSMTAGWFDGIFYGMVWRYITELKSTDFTDTSKMFGYMEPELVYSYDGKEFLYSSGKSLVERPMAPTPGWAGMEPTDMCESTDGQHYYLLFGGCMYVHGTAESNQHLHDKAVEKGYQPAELVYRIRKDGFCGLEAVGKGTVVTKGMAFLKDDLTFNLRADCGMVRFGLMNKKGEYIEGFSLDDCIPFEFDQGIEVKPQWKEHQLSEVLNQQVRVVIELNGAVLHAMSATAQPYIVQRQKSFADPQGIFE